MAEFRKKKLYTPLQNEPFSISRSKIQLFMECPRCFYLDRSEKYRKSRPSGPMSYIPTAIDILLKNDFDKCRSDQKVHPYLIENNLKLVPYKHQDIDVWRNNRKGITYHDQNTNLLISGAIDDCWYDTQSKKIFLADYKTTTEKIDKKTGNSIDPDLNEKGAPYKYWYKKQIEIYSWIFKKNGFDLSNTAYFLFCSALYKSVVSFSNKLEFRVNIVSYDLDDTWVDNTLVNLKKVLDTDELPEKNSNCDYCNYSSI